VEITGGGFQRIYKPGPDGGLGNLFLLAHLNDNNLYQVDPDYLNLPSTAFNYVCYDANATKAEAIEMLHKTLGHINVDRIQQLVSAGRVEWPSEFSPNNLRRCSNPCVACQLAGSRRSSHTGTIRVPQQPGELFYYDVYGPVETPSLLEGNVYVHGFLDACSKRA
jgi:hypothetical protein